MKRFRVALLSLLLTLAVWLVISWPLPKVLNEAISVGLMKRSNNQLASVHMMAGDHLQFVYYMWIFSDYLTGQTPWFHNVYEFNTDHDADRYRPGSYYFPFSLGFSAFYAFGNRAFAWNMISLATLWLAAYATWRLCRRYTDHDGIAATGALLALLFPYQWIQLYGGSPAGFGMALIPVLLLGLDRAVRDERVAGGWIAGLALLSASMTDTHVFFFGTLMVPCWCLVAFTQRHDFAWRKLGSYLRLALALSPVVLLAVLAYLQAQLGTRHIKQTASAGGRKISEVALFSPKADGLFAWHEIDVSYHIYFGFLVTALLLAGLVAWLVLAWKKRDRATGQTCALMSMLVVGVIGIVLLALGPFSPFEGRAFTAARKFIPNYTMIRQTAKIYVLLPALLALGVTLTLTGLKVWLPRRLAGCLVAVVAMGFAVEYYFQSKLLLGFIDDQNGAYAAVADDAKTMTDPAHVVVVPLWPGDSHYTSVYQHYVSLYRIRMINGYRPFVPKEYIDSVFTPFRSINHGVLSDGQIDDLLRRGIHFVILHEDLFPEKVSPFPVTTTLRNLLEHPRVTFLAQDGPVWSFRLEPSAVERKPLAQAWPYHFPARRLEAERQDINDGQRVDDPAASGGRYVMLSNGSSLATSPLFAPMLPNLRWALRARGQGEIRVASRTAGQTNALATFPVATTNWQWLEAHLTPFALSQDVAVEAHATSGAVDVDVIKLWAGSWTSPAPGETVTIPGPCFFHAGAIDLTTDSVNFRPDRDRQDLILYGPKLPLEAGHYEVAVQIESEAATGTSYGMWFMACPEGNEVGRMKLTAGGTNRTTLEVPSNLPFLAAFSYDGQTALHFRSVTITRLQ